MKFVWTDRKPEKEGWYWFKASGQFPFPKCDLLIGEVVTRLHLRVIVLVCYRAKSYCVRFPQGSWNVDDMPGLWSQRIPEPGDG